MAVVTLYSPKGGVGKTTLALALDGAALVAQTPPGAKFNVLTGGYPDTGENMGYKNVVSLVNGLKLQYEHIVLDTQSYLTDNVVAALQLHQADTVFIVLEDDLAAAARTAGVLEYLDNNKYVDLSKVQFVVNKRRGKDKFLSCAGLATQASRSVPLVKNLSGYRDRRLLKAVSPLCEGSEKR